MKKLVIAAAISAVGFVSVALAADMPTKAPVAPLPLAYNWTGFYVGINGGYGWGKSNWTAITGASTGDFDITGGLVGGTIGYNWQTGIVVLGVEGDIDGGSIRGTGNAVGGAPCCETKNTWLGTARARLGYAGWTRWLPYVTGGAAFGNIKMTSSTGSEAHSRTGWTAGGGLEYAIYSAWSVKAEYLYVDLGTTGCTTPTCIPNISVKYKTNILRAGLNYRF